MPPESGNIPPDTPYSLSSYDKKRLRDRRAQQNRRDKQESYIRALEKQAEFCEKHHGPGAGTGTGTGTGTGMGMVTTESVQQLLASADTLREENARLRARLGQVNELVRGWRMEDTTVPVPAREDSFAAVPTGHYIGTAVGVEAGVSSPEVEVTLPRPPPSSSSPQPPLPLPLSMSIDPAWALLPMNGEIHGAIFILPWLDRPDLAAACPPQPSSPLDLLHGTRRNYLADQIHRAVRRRALRDSECLALGWLVYLFTKWLLTPTPATFARLAPFHRPIPIQLHRSHPVTLDMLVWPQMRANLIQQWDRYDFAELMGFFSCCVKVRWPWGVDVLERDEDDNLRMKSEFMVVFFQESGWGLTTEFIEKYPEILEGMDVEALRFHMALPDVTDLETWFA